MNIGFDYDGTITNPIISKFFDILCGYTNLPIKLYELYIISNNVKIREIILTSRIIPNVKVISTENKAKIINTENIDLYFEDNPVEAKLIQEQCPNCKVVLVNVDWYEVEQNGGIFSGIKIKEEK